LAIGGAIVTIDAVGCQRDIADKILDKYADYVLALKGNQGQHSPQTQGRRMGRRIPRKSVSPDTPSASPLPIPALSASTIAR
jgi:hypothetical protein